jgi:ATP-binding cassette subfamily B protein/subfamily B ATP-binding cassette protein MsbA
MQVQSHVQRSLAGLNVIQAFSQEQREHERFIHFAGSLIRARQKSALLGGLAELFSGLTNVLGTAVVLYVGSRQVLAHQLSLGELLVFVAYLATLQLQFKSFAATFIAFQTVGASIDRVRELLNSPDDPPQRPGAIELAHVSGRVEIEDAWFGYAGESAPAVLRGVSIRADVGSRVAIVGPTGAGKSTLLALIPRLFDPQKGRVLIDGHDIRELTIDSVRRAIAMVPQDPVLLPISIAQNIAFAAPEASMEQIICAARAAEAHEFIEKLPMGYDTIVGQRGSTLSGGQRQRIAIARAFVKEAPIVLMDEPTSGLDALTESSVLTAMNRLMQGRTVLVIAHRLSTIRSADLIVVLENGVIAEQGSHDALLAGDGLYAKYHAIQFASSSDAAADAPALLGVSAVGG